MLPQSYSSAAEAALRPPDLAVLCATCTTLVTPTPRFQILYFVEIWAACLLYPRPCSNPANQFRSFFSPPEYRFALGFDLLLLAARSSTRLDSTRPLPFLSGGFVVSDRASKHVSPVGSVQDCGSLIPPHEGRRPMGTLWGHSIYGGCRLMGTLQVWAPYGHRSQDYALLICNQSYYSCICL